MKQNLRNNLAWLWENGERILIILFLATFTLNVRKVFLTPLSFLNGYFNEYLTPSFSWADLVMLAVIIMYTIKWLYCQFVPAYNWNITPENKKTTLSSITSLVPIKSRETFLLFLFLVWLALSVFWSPYKPIAVCRTVTLLELIAFLSILAIKFRDIKWLKIATFSLLVNGAFQSAIGIAQFASNSSLGLGFLGESIVSPDLPGVAKIILAGEKHIRAYGTFPHPNVMAGFLIIPIFILLGELISRLASTDPEFQGNVPYGTLIPGISRKVLLVLLIVILAGFGLTFSRSAFLGLSAGILSIFLINLKSGIAFLKAFCYPRLKSGKFAALAIILVFLFAFLKYSSFFSTKSILERDLYQNVSYEIISDHSVVGTGLGQFVLAEFQKHPNLEGWQYQPVHNTYFLITSELGILGLVLFLLFISSLLGRGIGDDINILTYQYIYCIIISFLVISIFDHYFWDIKVGTITFAIAVAFLKIASAENKSEGI